MAPARLAEDKKNARRWRATIVFVDETGFSLTPAVSRTSTVIALQDVVRHRTVPLLDEATAGAS